MNKAMIKKYKKEFEHWLCSGSVLVKVIYNTGSKWAEIQSDYAWENTEALLVVNDKYVELRKALAEGKTMQNIGSGQWLDLDFPMFSEDITRYRIKPNEPIYYYQWEQLQGATIWLSNHITDKQAEQDLVGIWRKIESSKRTWEEDDEKTT